MKTFTVSRQTGGLPHCPEPAGSPELVEEIEGLPAIKKSGKVGENDPPADVFCIASAPTTYHQGKIRQSMPKAPHCTGCTSAQVYPRVQTSTQTPCPHRAHYRHGLPALHPLPTQNIPKTMPILTFTGCRPKFHRHSQRNVQRVYNPKPYSTLGFGQTPRCHESTPSSLLKSPLP